MAQAHRRQFVRGVAGRLPLVCCDAPFCYCDCVYVRWVAPDGEKGESEGVDGRRGGCFHIADVSIDCVGWVSVSPPRSLSSLCVCMPFLPPQSAVKPTP